MILLRRLYISVLYISISFYVHWPEYNLPFSYPLTFYIMHIYGIFYFFFSKSGKKKARLNANNNSRTVKVCSRASRFLLIILSVSLDIFFNISESAITLCLTFYDTPITLIDQFMIIQPCFTDYFLTSEKHIITIFIIILLSLYFLFLI